jgi:hypothetical protein
MCLYVTVGAFYDSQGQRWVCISVHQSSLAPTIVIIRITTGPKKGLPDHAGQTDLSNSDSFILRDLEVWCRIVLQPKTIRAFHPGPL